MRRCWFRQAGTPLPTACGKVAKSARCCPPEFSTVPKDPGKCEELKCSCNSIKLKTCFADSFMRELFVGQIRKILGNNDCGFCKNTPIRTTVETIQLLKILPPQNLHVFGHRVRIQLEVLKQHTPPMQTSFSRVQFTWRCRCEMCCSQRRYVYTLREAEHVHTDTVETTIVQLERLGFLGFRTCTSATSATSTSNARSSLNVSVIQPSHSAAQCFQPRKLRMSATKRSATMRGVDTGRGSSESACCMVSGTSCFSQAHVHST